MIIYLLFPTHQHFFKVRLLEAAHTVVVWSCRMQSAPSHSSEYLTGVRSLTDYGWLRAGLTSFAYRLAHLCVPRLVVLFGVAVAFVFI